MFRGQPRGRGWKPTPLLALLSSLALGVSGVRGDAGEENPLPTAPAMNPSAPALVPMHSSPAAGQQGDAQPIMPEKPSPLLEAPRPASFFDPDNYVFSVVGGASYYSVPGETRWGGFEGLWGGIRMYDSWYGVGSFSANEISAGTQFLGTVGLVRLPSWQDCGLCDRILFVALFDQFTDTRIEDLYVSDLRLRLGYALTPRWTAGVTYAEPVTKDHDVLFIDPVAGPNVGTVGTTQRVGAFASTRILGTSLLGEVGYREDPDCLTLNLYANTYVSERCSVYLNSAYEDRGAWAGALGIQFALGGCKQSELQCALDRQAHADDVVRGGAWIEYKKEEQQRTLREVEALIENAKLQMAQMQFKGVGKVEGTNLQSTSTPTSTTVSSVEVQDCANAILAQKSPTDTASSIRRSWLAHGFLKAECPTLAVLNQALDQLVRQGQLNP